MGLCWLGKLRSLVFCYSKFKPKCDATAGGVNPAGQIGLILFVLVALSVGTFLYQRHRRNKVCQRSFRLILILIRRTKIHKLKKPKQRMAILTTNILIKKQLSEWERMVWTIYRLWKRTHWVLCLSQDRKASQKNQLSGGGATRLDTQTLKYRMNRVFQHEI